MRRDEGTGPCGSHPQAAVAGREQLGGLFIVLVTVRRAGEPTVAGRAPPPPPPPPDAAVWGVGQQRTLAQYEEVR